MLKRLHVTRRVQLGTLLLAGAVAGTLLLIPSGAGGRGQQDRPKPIGKTPIGKIVVPVKAETIRFDFQQSREAKTRSFALKADPPLGQKPVIRKELAGDLTNDSGSEFPEDQVDRDHGAHGVRKCEGEGGARPDGQS
jgi:hypothetical protein